MSNALYEANREIRRNISVDIIKNSSREFLKLLSEDNGIYKLSKIFNVYKEAENNLLRVFEEYKNGDSFIRDSKEWQMFRNELHLRYEAAREAVKIMEKAEITNNDARAFLKICQSLGVNLNQNRPELLQTLKEINLTERELDNLIQDVNEAERLSVTEWLDKMGRKELNLLNKKDYEEMLSGAWELRKASFNKMLALTPEKTNVANVAEFSNPFKDWVANSARDGALFEAALGGNVNKDDLMARILKDDSRALLGQINEQLNIEDVCCQEFIIEETDDSTTEIKIKKQRSTQDKDLDDKSGR